MKVYHSCEKCLKYSVCVLSTEYKADIEKLKNMKLDKAINISITCNEYYPQSEYNIRRADLSNQVE